jgi:site-specific DNA-methyltransferase (cytosine-N4-specific)
MKRLLALGRYNAGPRPSEHNIGPRSFLKNNKGAIPSNVISVSNTRPNSDYLRYCRQSGLQPHPARMPIQVAEFFISFLTEPGDLVLDPFAGSNTTGAAAEHLGRRWIAIEPSKEYVEGSRGRFLPLFTSRVDRD